MVLYVYNQEVAAQKFLDTMYIVSLIKLSLREGNIALSITCFQFYEKEFNCTASLCYIWTGNNSSLIWNS